MWALTTQLACGGVISTARSTFAAARPVIAGMERAGTLTALEATNLNNDFDQFTVDVNLIDKARRSGDHNELIRAVRKLANDILVAAPHFRLGNPLANQKFQTVYSIAQSVGEGVLAYFDVARDDSAQPPTKAMRSKPSESDLKRELKRLKEELEK